MIAAIRWFLIAASLALAALLGFAFDQQYWRWRDCFNELGRCYDPVEGVVYLEQSGVVWGSAAAIALSVALALWLIGRKRRL